MNRKTSPINYKWASATMRSHLATLCRMGTAQITSKSGWFQIQQTIIHTIWATPSIHWYPQSLGLPSMAKDSTHTAQPVGLVCSSHVTSLFLSSQFLMVRSPMLSAHRKKCNYMVINMYVLLNVLHACMYACVYVSMYLFIYVCKNIYIYKY